MLETTIEQKPRLCQMTFSEWRTRNKELAEKYLSGEEEGDIPCPKCDGEGEVTCTCDECGDDHETECKQCGGDGWLVGTVTEKNLEEVMRTLYNEQAARDAKLLLIWEKRNASVRIRVPGLQPASRIVAALRAAVFACADVLRHPERAARYRANKPG